MAKVVSNDQVVSVGGRTLKLTNLDKLMYPATGTTKGEVINYYAQVAEFFINHAADRPATRKRWVHGVGTAQQPGSVFFQKNLDSSTPDWVVRFAIEHSTRENLYPVVNDLPTLTWLAQIAALEIHVPQWRFDSNGNRRNPDRLVLDLDPGDGVGLPECAEVAKLCRPILEGMGLTAVPVTSGSKGIHLYSALPGEQSPDQVSAVAHQLARMLEADHPDLVVSDMKKVLRKGKVLLDWSQNNGNKTTIAPYSLRGTLHPMVACPRTWDELDEPAIAQLDYLEVLDRLSEAGDPMAGIDPPVAALDRLEIYRSKRDASKTPEPVPVDEPSPTDGQMFVIQEHHARRLHYDLRLERNGVLVSWAIPKGPPMSTDINHLAVQTEDHPIQYATFEGAIPAGEYGAGSMSIWDSGRYELEKWRDGKEIIMTLHGQSSGGLQRPRRYALIHTGGRDAKSSQNWLIHLMKDQQPLAQSEPSRVRDGKLPDIKPMLATAGTIGLVKKGDWAYEIKWDGFRCIAAVCGGSVKLRSRSGMDMSATFPELQELAEYFRGHDVIVDGEIVALDSSGRPSFGLLQTRANLTQKEQVAAARKKQSVQLMIFDLLRIDDDSLLRRPYAERREALEGLSGAQSSTIHVPPALEADADGALAMSKSLKLEGIVAKARTSVYQPGQRAQTWIKIKNHRSIEVVIIGWRPGKGNRASLAGSLLMAVPDDAQLRYVGRVGSGFTEREIREMTMKLAADERETPAAVGVPDADRADAHWVDPKYVGEVIYSDTSSEGKLRHPVWKGWRIDKTPDDLR
ncbi:MAG: ATP-dependent DNA ligase [Antricoccus sp.]